MSVRFGTLAEALAYQQGAHGQAIDLGLERVREVASRMGLGAADCPVAIVAGTNGKGSTACMLAALLSGCGRRVGLFTSPHLVRYNERIQIDGVEATDEALLAAFEHIEQARRSVTLTFFEYNTLAALELFRDADVGAMVLEVGLGGRLDATNIIDADVAVLCSVGFDHRDWLGDTLEKIGGEKAGIFRASRPVVLGSSEMPASVWQRARELNCPVFAAERDFHAVRIPDDPAGRWSFDSVLCRLPLLPSPPLRGAIQYSNAATALMALNLLGIEGSCDAARLAPALREVRLPGRFQVVAGPVEWILDVAHNEPAAQVLAESLHARPCGGRTLAVAGLLADKDVAAVARALDAEIDFWLLADVIDEPRGLTASALQSRLPALRGPIERLPGVVAACERARALARIGDRVIVLGSFHVVGPALIWLGLY